MLANEEILSTCVEVTGLPASPDKVHVDDIVQWFSSGKRVFVQAKSTSPAKRGWSIDKLYADGELTKIIAQLTRCHEDCVELVCPDGFSDFEELLRDVNAYHDFVSFSANANASSLKRLMLFCEKLELDGAAAVDCLSRVSIGSKHSYSNWKAEIIRELSRLTSDVGTANDSLFRLVAEHSIRDPAAPRILTRKILRDRIVNGPTPNPLVAQEAVELAPWNREEHRRFFPVRLVPIEPGKAEVRKRLSPRYLGPNLQMGIRPVITSEIDLDVLIGKMLSGEASLPEFWPHVRGDTYRNEFGLMSCQIWVPPPLDMSFGARMRRWLRILEDEEPRFEYFSHLYERAELWLLDGTTVPTSKEFIGKSIDDDVPRTIVGDLEKRFVKTLDAARFSLKSLGLMEPFDVYVGVVGVGTSRLEILAENGLPSGVFSHVNKETTLEKNLCVTSASETSLDVLRPFFMDIWKAYLTTRPPYYDRLVT